MKMKPSHSRSSFPSSSSSTTVTYTFHDQIDPPSQPTSADIPIQSSETPTIPITVHLPLHAESTAATKIQSTYRSHLIRTLYRKISSVNSEADQLQRLIQRQDTVDAVRSDNREKLRMNESLMGLLLRLDSVPGVDLAVREARRKVNRRIEGLQEILDAVSEAKVEDGDGGCWGYDEFLRNWDEVAAEMEEEDVCRNRGGEKMERLCAQQPAFRCLRTVFGFMMDKAKRE